MTLKLSLFEPAAAEAWQPLREATRLLAEELATLGYPLMEVLRCPPPATMAGASQNRFQSPLRAVAGEWLWRHEPSA